MSYYKAHLAIYCVLGLAAAGGASFSITAFWRDKVADAGLKRAESALALHDFTRARAELQSYLALRPGDAEAHWLLARTERRSLLYFQFQPDWEASALHHLAESSRLQYDSEALELESALLATARGELPRVQSYLLGKLGHSYPDAAIVLEALVPAYLASHLLPPAMEQVTRLLAIDPENAQAWYWRGLIREQLLFNRLAAEDFTKALALNPNLEEARRPLARICLSAKQIDEALTQYDILHRLHPDDSEILVGMAQCCHAKGQEYEARDWLDRLPAAAAESGPALLLRGQLALEAGQNKEAEALLRKAVSASPQEAQGYYSLAQCLRHNGQSAESAALIARFERMTADFHRYTALTDRMRTDSRDPAVLCEAGMIMLGNGMTDGGLGWLASALRADPNYAPAHLALARYYQEKGDAKQAEFHRQSARTALARSPGGLPIP